MLGTNTEPPKLSTLSLFSEEVALRAYNPLLYACFNTHGRRTNVVKAADEKAIRRYKK